MTIVIAKKFGERILTLSDTADFDVRRSKPNLVPGILKSIILDMRTSISFAGATERSLDIIRKARRMLLEDSAIEDVLAQLAESTLDGKCEFLISFHRNDAELRKVVNGKISDPLELSWIGDSAAVDKTKSSKTTAFDLPDYISQDEMNFIRGFQAALQEHKMLTDSAGGMPIVHLSSPFGHTYQDLHVSTLGGEITIGPAGISPLSQAARSEYQFDYTVVVVTPRERGAAVIGSFFSEAHVGYIYSPIEADEPEKLIDISLEELREVLSERARSLGGVVVD